MNIKRHTTAMLPALFGPGLFTSQHHFVLATPDTPDAGKGTFEVLAEQITGHCIHPANNRSFIIHQAEEK